MRTVSHIPLLNSADNENHYGNGLSNIPSASQIRKEVVLLL